MKGVGAVKITIPGSTHRPRGDFREGLIAGVETDAEINFGDVVLNAVFLDGAKVIDKTLDGFLQLFKRRKIAKEILIAVVVVVAVVLKHGGVLSARK